MKFTLLAVLCCALCVGAAVTVYPFASAGLSPEVAHEAISAEEIAKRFSSHAAASGKSSSAVDQKNRSRKTPKRAVPTRGPSANNRAKSSNQSSWLKGDKDKRKRLARLERLQRAPGLDLDPNHHPREAYPSVRRGKIVVLKFWATWCPPCLKSIEHDNKLYRQYKSRGVELIGICCRNGADKMEEIRKEYRIQYPLGIDQIGGKTAKTYKVAGYPSYYIIDRSGKLRFADCRRSKVDDAVDFLVNER